METEVFNPSVAPVTGTLGSHLRGPFQITTVGVWFYREPTWLSRAIRLLGNRYTHVTARVGPCVFEQKLNRPTSWYSVDAWETEYPPAAKVEWQQALHVPLVDTVCVPGESTDIWNTIREYLCHPVYPTAQNCLTGPRNLLRIAGRNCHAVSPDGLYRQVLDLQGTVQHPEWLPGEADDSHAQG